MKQHIPVLLKEMLSYLSPKNDGLYIDATFGSGGYSNAILQSADCKIYAIDRDETVIKFYEDLNIRYPNKIKLFIKKFSEIKTVLDKDFFKSIIGESFNIKTTKNSKREFIKKNKIISSSSSCNVNYVDGVVFDIGLSSMQLEDKNRGFSFLHNGPLDMRMDSSLKINASTFVNLLQKKKIANIIYKYGGERYSYKIANAIISARKRKFISTTFELANIVRSVFFHKKRGRIDHATRTFQAIRIWVNNELEELKNGIKFASDILNKNGRLIVVTFHSLEDSIVKTFFKSLCKRNINNFKTFSIVNKKVIKPSFEEISTNPRSRSAKLRVIERLS